LYFKKYKKMQKTAKKRPLFSKKCQKTRQNGKKKGILTIFQFSP